MAGTNYQRCLSLSGLLTLQLYLLPLEVLPVGPGQDPQHQAPQQTPDLRQAQAARLCLCGLFLWGCGRLSAAVRTAAGRASVTCRYQPCALRTS